MRCSSLCRSVSKKPSTNRRRGEAERTVASAPLRVKYLRAHHAQTFLAVSTVEPLSTVPSSPLITRMSAKRLRGLKAAE
jgi:hypothetical protein